MNSEINFKYVGSKLLDWYSVCGRNLPWRQTQNPYKIWISEIILQQTQVKQGLNHYLKFVERFPDVKTLAEADTDEVLLYWKGLGYYSRALNLHKAAQQIMNDFGGVFPSRYEDILQLKGIGKYTVAAIASICFSERKPAIDGNFYRVFSRWFADDYDISQSGAFSYFSELAMIMMPDYDFGNFNQAIMDLGATICKPQNPLCEECPINEDCRAFQLGKTQNFPVKTKKTKASDVALEYYFIYLNNNFLITQRNDDFIWKKLYEFPNNIPEKWKSKIEHSTTIKHKLTHKNLTINIHSLEIESKNDFEDFAIKNGFITVNSKSYEQKSFPKPLETFIKNQNKMMKIAE